MTIRFTRGPLGTLERPTDVRFADETVTAGDVGELVDTAELEPGTVPEGWGLARVEVDGNTRYVPVHPAHYEEA